MDEDAKTREKRSTWEEESMWRTGLETDVTPEYDRSE